MACLLRLAKQYIDYPLRPDDDETTRTRKQVVLIAGTASVFVNTTVTVANIDYMQGYVLSGLFYVLIGFCLTQLLVFKRLSQLSFDILMLSVCLIFLGNDMALASEGGDRLWPIQMLFMDIQLLGKTRTNIQRITLGLVFFYLTITTVEKAFRFGIYDMPGLPSQERRHEIHDCTDLPCASPPVALHNYVQYVCIFLLDYYFTRGFAENLRSEKQKVEASVETAEKIARSLADFDLDTAEEVLETETGGLPPKLHAAFDNVLQNLRLYRPFLPDALFEGSQNGLGDGEEGGNPLSNLVPPGTSGESGGKLAIVFTDIQQSTSIWEACPDGMKRALKLHNKTIRRQIELHQGYEVKTIGDAFMVAFSEAVDAVDFSLAVQRELVGCSWPAELLELPLCERDAEGLWGGLRVRVGVHFGEAEVELNSITGRFDYFGNTVNVAARVESASVGGAVAVTPEVMAAVDDRSGFAEVPIGAVTLKGVSKNARLTALIPQSLGGRRSFVEGQLRSKTSGDIKSEGSQHSLASTARVFAESAQTRIANIISATVGCVEVKVGTHTSDGSPDYGGLNERVCRTLHSLDRCGGTVIAVAGSSITVGWNTAKKTATHFEGALRFTSLVLSRRYERSEVSVGLSSGPAATATIGTHGQRFVTVLGDCVKLAAALAGAAAEFQTPALFSSSSLTHFFAGLRGDLKSILRPLVTWEARTHDKVQPLVVYEVSVSRLCDTDLTAMVKHEEETLSPRSDYSNWSWSDAYWTAFDAGDKEEIEKQASQGDVTLRVAVAAMRREPRVLSLR